MEKGEIKETEGTFITGMQKVGVIKVPSKVKKSQYLISTCTNSPTSAIQIASISKLTMCTAWEEILKCLKFKLKMDSVSLRIVKF